MKLCQIILYIILLYLIYLIITSQKESYDNDIMLDIQRVNAKPKDMRTIFVSVASYRDKECPLTINEIFGKAKNPDRIIVGICQQNAAEDVDCFNPKFKDNIRIIRFSDKEAKGPTFARYMCSKLYNNEDYFMQIDSHTMFEKNWDELIIDMMRPQKMVLSAYPNDWGIINDDSRHGQVPIVCYIHFDKDAGEMLNALGGHVSNPTDIIESPYTAAGFIFTYGCFMKEIPFDPDLPQLFWGEEALFTIRLWTNGWDIFAPSKNIIYHYYTRSEAPKYFENPDYQMWQPKSFEKVKYLLQISDKYPELPMKYGLGKVRSLQDYYKYIGFDNVNKTDKNRVDFCIKYQNSLSKN